MIYSQALLSIQGLGLRETARQGLRHPSLSSVRGKIHPDYSKTDELVLLDVLAADLPNLPSAMAKSRLNDPYDVPKLVRNMAVSLGLARNDDDYMYKGPLIRKLKGYLSDRYPLNVQLFLTTWLRT